MVANNCFVSINFFFQVSHQGLAESGENVYPIWSFSWKLVLLKSFSHKGIFREETYTWSEQWTFVYVREREKMEKDLRRGCVIWNLWSFSRTCQLKAGVLLSRLANSQRAPVLSFTLQILLTKSSFNELTWNNNPVWQAVVIVGAVRKPKSGLGEKMGKGHENSKSDYQLLWKF